MKPITISSAEWEVMDLVWQRSPVSASEIVQALSGPGGWHSRTIRTLLDRLVKKKALAAERDGKRYLYEPRISREECVCRESESFLAKVFRGEPASMLLHFAKAAKLSNEDIRKLRQVLKDKEK